MSTLPTVVSPPPRGRGGPRRWSAADKAAALAAFATTRLTLKAFCAKRGVPRATFGFWRREVRAARAPQPSRTPPRSPARRDRPTFARVELPPPPPPRAMTLVVRGPGGIEAELTGLDASMVVTMVVTVLGAVLHPEAR
jgi:transposase-like protein